jgi:hypothetical protein
MLLGDAGGYAMPDGAVREKDFIFLIDDRAAARLNVFRETGWIVARN